MSYVTKSFFALGFNFAAEGEHELLSKYVLSTYGWFGMFFHSFWRLLPFGDFFLGVIERFERNIDSASSIFFY